MTLDVEDMKEDCPAAGLGDGVITIAGTDKMPVLHAWLMVSCIHLYILCVSVPIRGETATHCLRYIGRYSSYSAIKTGIPVHLNKKKTKYIDI